MKGTPPDWQARAREQFEAVLFDVDALLKSAREQLAVTFNLGLRCLRAVTAYEEVSALVVELAAAHAEKVAIFSFWEGSARADAMRNLGGHAIEFLPNEAAAFQTAIETQDPVVAMGTAPEISRVLAERLGNESPARVFLYPLSVRGKVTAVLMATGNVQAAALELIAGVAALQMETLTEVKPSKNLVNIAGIQAKPDGQTNAWDELSPQLQSLHLQAQRKARLRVAEMQIEHRQAVLRGRGKADLYGELREPIDTARDEYRRNFLASTPTMVDYLYLELIRGLAQGDDHKLGPSFPGPLV